MIEQGKQRNALAALNAILVLARHLARQGSNLVELARKRPDFELALQRFDAATW